MTLEEVAALADRSPDPPFGRLVRGTPAAGAVAVLRQASLAALLGAEPADPAAARAVLAGLWCYADGFDEAHAIVQDLPGTWGAWWHAILHRREPDADNARYWYRRVRPPEDTAAAVAASAAAAAAGAGAAELEPLARRLAGGWDPGALVEACERARVERWPAAAVAGLAVVQREEWWTVMRRCAAMARGG